MTDLSPQDTALLALARDGNEPSAIDRARVRVALAARLGVGSGLAVTTVMGGSEGVAGASTTAVVTGGGVTTAGAGIVSAHAALSGVPAFLNMARVLTATVLAGMLGGGSVVAYRALNVQPKPTKSGSTSSDSTRSATAIRDALSRPVGGTPATPDHAQAETWQASGSDLDPLEKTSPILPRPPRPNWRVASSPDKSPAALPSLQAETRLVRSGVAALHAGKPRRALALFEEHARLFSHGFLAQERDAERIIALCDLGRVTEARVAAAAFLRPEQRTPLATRVRTSCGWASNP